MAGLEDVALEYPALLGCPQLPVWVQGTGILNIRYFIFTNIIMQADFNL